MGFESPFALPGLKLRESAKQWIRRPRRVRLQRASTASFQHSECLGTHGIGVPARSRTAMRARFLCQIGAANDGIARDATAPCGISPSPSAREGCSASTTNRFRSPLSGVRPRSPSRGLVSLDVLVNTPGWCQP